MLKESIYPLLITTIMVLTILSAPSLSAKSETVEITLFSGNKWTKVLGGDRIEMCHTIRQTSDGGYVLAASTCSYGAGASDIWLIKLDKYGRKVWDRTFGGVKDDYPFCVEQTSDGGYIIVGYTESFGAGYIDVWLIKTDENGNEVWNRTFGGKNWDRGLWVEQISEGGYIIAGDTKSYGQGGLNGWIIKTDEDGNEIWNRTFGEKSRPIMLKCIHQVEGGGYIVAGEILYRENDTLFALLIKLDKDGNEEWRKTYGCDTTAYCVQQTSDGGYIIAGDNWTHDLIIKTDENGNVEWKRTLFDEKETWYSTARSVQQTRDGGYIVTGWRGDITWISLSIIVRIINPYHYFPKAWLVKLDKDGNEEWIRSFFGIGYWMWGLDVHQTADNGYIVAGRIERYSCWNESDIFVIKTDSKGRTNFLQLKLCGIIHWFVKRTEGKGWYSV
ncbi:MAG: hypothetical protein DRN18_03700 [Thermoplasmata archaeon]|nr:MAG: hypothetical protein DRN18_03700 [Thermoplasmata archaeon]